MQYIEHEPPAVLARHVQCLWRLSDVTPAAEPQTLYPDGRCEIIVHLATPTQILTADGHWIQQTPTLFAGQATRAIRLRATSAIDCVGIRLHPAAGSVLFHTQAGARSAISELSELSDLVVDLRSLDARFATALQRAMTSERDPFASVVIQTLADRFRPLPIDTRIEAAVRLIDEADGNLPITRLARVTGSSVRTLQTRFLAAVGITPKQYARVRRLQATIRQLDEDRGTLATMSLESGFADQAHATRDVQRIAGITPGRLRRALAAERDGDRTLSLAAAFVRGVKL
jgi:AraC-like DNA-binding protein